MTITGRSLIALSLLAMAGCTLFQRDGSPPEPESPRPVKLRFHLASTEEVEGYQAARDEHGRLLYVTPTAFLTERDVWNASALASEKESLILLTLTEGGTMTMEWITRENVGRRLAVFIDDQLVMSPLVQAPLTGGKLYLAGGFSQAQAEKLARRLNAQRASFGPQFGGKEQ